MERRSYLFACVWVMSLGTLLCLLASCGNSLPSISPNPTTNATERMATTTAFSQVTADPLFNMGGIHWHPSVASRNRRNSYDAADVG